MFSPLRADVYFYAFFFQIIPSKQPSSKPAVSGPASPAKESLHQTKCSCRTFSPSGWRKQKKSAFCSLSALQTRRGSCAYINGGRAPPRHSAWVQCCSSEAWKQKEGVVLLTAPLFTGSCCSVQENKRKMPSRNNPFITGFVATHPTSFLFFFLIHGPVLRLAVKSTNRPLSSLLALFSSKKKEKKKQGRGLKAQDFLVLKASCSTTRGKPMKMSRWMNKTIKKPRSWTHVS